MADNLEARLETDCVLAFSISPDMRDRLGREPGDLRVNRFTSVVSAGAAPSIAEKSCLKCPSFNSWIGPTKGGFQSTYNIKCNLMNTHLTFRLGVVGSIVQARRIAES